jgi:predicted HD phosphohydrolase
MDLYHRVGNAYRTGGVDVESYEDERTMMVCSIFPDIFALHCSHISAKRHRCAQSSTRAEPADLRVNDETVEITDFRRIIDLRQRYW